MTSTPIYQTLDPTLVLPREQWMGLCHDVNERNYIAVYDVKNENSTVEFAREVARLMKKPIVIIRTNLVNRGLQNLIIIRKLRKNAIDISAFGVLLYLHEKGIHHQIIPGDNGLHLGREGRKLLRQGCA